MFLNPMKKIILLLLFYIPSLYGALTISSGSISTDGYTVTIIMNDSVLSGSTTNCFVFTGNISVTNTTLTPTSVTLTGGAGITIVSSFPLFQSTGGVPYTTAITVNNSGTCALMGGTQGNTGSGSTSPTLTNNSTWYAAGDSFYTSKITPQGAPLNAADGNGYLNTFQWTSSLGGVDFHVISSNGIISVWVFSFGNPFVSLYQDGILVSRIQSFHVGTGYYGMAQWTGLDTGNHVFSFVNTDAGAPVAAYGLPAISIPGAVYTTLPTVKTTITACGASWVNISGEGSATHDSTQGTFGLMDTAIGIVTQGAGESGVPLYPALAADCPSKFILPNNTSAPLAIMEPDSNDIFTQVALVNVQSAAQTVVTNTMASAHPPTKLLYVLPWSTAGIVPMAGAVCATFTASQCLIAYQNAMIAGVTAAANPNTIIINGYNLSSGAPNWYNDISNICGTITLPDIDSIAINHPCAATALNNPGFGKSANRLTPVIAAQLGNTSWSVSGSTSGGHSLTLTLTLANGAIWYDPITYTSSISSDTICLASTCSTGSVTLAPSVGTNTVNLTVAGADGIHILTPSNLPNGWIAPSATMVTLMGDNFSSTTYPGTTVKGSAIIH
jgi:hypothetical protein